MPERTPRRRRTRFLCALRPALAATVAAFLSLPAAAAEKISVLHVENGEFVRGGKPFRGIGVNYFDAFSRGLDGNAPADGHLEGFRLLREFDIPFIRFHCGGFYPVNWQPYRDDPDAWFRRLDRFVAEAEAHGVGLIPSLFWSWFTFPAMAGEPASAWGDPESGIHRFLKRYVTEVVTRYRESPAVLA